MDKIIRFLSLLLFVIESATLAAAVPPPVRILPLGDSLTIGFNRIEGGYRTRLYARLADAGFNPDFVGTQTAFSINPLLPDHDHEGHGGWQIHELDRQIEGRLSAVEDPDVVLLLIGTNDYGSDNDLHNARNRLENLLAHIAVVRPHARILVGNLLLRTDNPALDHLIQTTFNAFLPGIVDHQASLGRQVSLVDLRGALGPDDLEDGLHPSRTGYDKLADRWFSAITNVISPLGTTHPPAIVRANAHVDLKRVAVVFSKPVEDAATNLVNFSLSGGLPVLRAELDPASKRIITLTTGRQETNTTYTLTLSGVRDRTPEQHEIAPGSFVGFQSGAVAEAADYTLVYALKLPERADYNASGVPYGEDHHSEVGPFSRIAYYLELQQAGSPAQFLWVSMDAFTGDIRRVGVPAAQTGAFFRQALTNMNVRSSVAGMVTGDGFSGGTIEFWPGNYSPENSADVPHASSTVYDCGDTAVPGHAGHGSMQVHNPAASQTLFAFNGWGGAGLIADLGLGNHSGRHPDWTFAQNAPSYTTRILEVYVLPSGAPQAAPVITTEPLGGAVPAGEGVVFTVGAVGQPPLSYQWRFNGEALIGATRTNYTIGNVQPADSGNYDVVVSNEAGTITSAGAVLTLVQPGVIVNGSFESESGGWMSSGNQTIASSGLYQAADGGKLVVFNRDGLAPDAILLQSVPTIVGRTYVLEFSAGVFASNPIQQRLGVTVEGAGTLVSEAFSLFGPHSGGTRWLSKRFVFVADSETTTLTFQDLSALSRDVDLVLDHVRLASTDAPVIMREPSSATLQPGDPVTLTVAARGLAPLSYQWRLDGMNLTGANESSYAIGSVQAGDSGNYDVVVSNAAGSVTSQPALLAVGRPGAFLNGSFESSYTGWRATGHLVIAPANYDLTTDGTRRALFNSGQSTPDGVLSQTFATRAGRTYTLEFDAGVHAFNRNEQRLHVTVQGIGTLLSRTVSIFGIGGGQPRWISRAYTFRANSATTTLTFRDVSPTTSALDLLLDHVRVNPRSASSPSESFLNHILSGDRNDPGRFDLKKPGYVFVLGSVILAGSAMLPWIMPSGFWRWRIIKEAWKRYWFPPTPLVYLGLMRIVCVAIQLWLMVGGNPGFDPLKTVRRLSDQGHDPPSALQFLLMPLGLQDRPVSDFAVLAVWWSTLAVGVLALVGVRTNLSLLLFAFGSTFLQAYSNSFVALYRGEALMIIALWMLVVSPAGRSMSVKAILAKKGGPPEAFEKSRFAAWPLLLVQWMLGIMYLDAAIQKLCAGGAGWLSGFTLEYHLLRDSLSRGGELGVWLAGQHTAVWSLSLMTILFEATFWIVIFRPQMSRFYVPAGLGFHLGAWLMLGAPFPEYLALYIVFLPQLLGAWKSSPVDIWRQCASLPEEEGHAPVGLQENC